MNRPDPGGFRVVGGRFVKRPYKTGVTKQSPSQFFFS